MAAKTATQSEVVVVRVSKATASHLDEVVKVREAQGNPTTRSGLARDLIESGLSRATALRKAEGLPLRDAMLMHVDGANGLLDWVSERDPEAAVRLAMDAVIAFGKWAEMEAESIGKTPAEIYEAGIGDKS